MREFEVICKESETGREYEAQVREKVSNQFFISLPDNKSWYLSFDNNIWEGLIDTDKSDPFAGVVVRLGDFLLRVPDLMDYERLHTMVVNHWRENVEKARERKLNWWDISGERCAYCQIFNFSFPTPDRKFKSLFCSGCPVKKVTGLSGCDRTPWVDLNKALPVSSSTEEETDWQEVEALCCDMLTLLESLKPGTHPVTEELWTTKKEK